MTKRFRLKGAVAVVTGAASGIGAALAAVLAARGCDLALCDVNATGLEQAAEQARAAGAKVSTHALDVSDAEAVAALPDAVAAAHRRASVLVNNAGVSLGGTFEQASEADFDWVMDVNFHGLVRMTRAFMPLLRREPAAHVVNISSLFGLIAPPGQTAYAASKFAVRGFSESLRHELAGSPIGLTVVHPGGVKTNIAVNARRSQGLSNSDTEAEQERWDRLLSLPPPVAAEEIARAVERRAPRLLIGKDAKRAALIQRLFPAGYWRLIAGMTE